jgi:hypothetical protein
MSFAETPAAWRPGIPQTLPAFGPLALSHPKIKSLPPFVPLARRIFQFVAVLLAEAWTAVAVPFKAVCFAER